MIPTPQPTTGAPSVATSAAAQTAPAGDECNSDAIPNLHSTSHEVNVATTEQVIDMEWDVPDGAPTSYNFAFSQNPEEPPDLTEQLPGDATDGEQRSHRPEPLVVLPHPLRRQR